MGVADTLRRQHIESTVDDLGRRLERIRIVRETSTAWPRLLDQAAGALQLRPSEDGFGASDQASFYAAGLPVPASTATVMAMNPPSPSTRRSDNVDSPTSPTDSPST